MWNVKVKVTQSCLILCDLMGYRLPDSSVHGILQARILEWVAIPFSRDQTQVSHIAGGFFTTWATREFLSNIVRILQLNTVIFPSFFFFLLSFFYFSLSLYVYICIYYKHKSMRLSKLHYCSFFWDKLLFLIPCWIFTNLFLCPYW